MPESGTCSSCGAEILFISLMTLEGGRTHPVDREPAAAPAVNMIAVRRIEFAGLVGILLTPERMQKRLGEFIEKGAAWHRSHFASCPSADEFRRRNPDQIAMEL